MHGEGYLPTFYSAIHPTLLPGEGVDAMNRDMLKLVAAAVDGLSKRKGGAMKVPLFGWVKHQISLATTGAVYGPHNPFGDPAIESAYW